MKYEKKSKVREIITVYIIAVTCSTAEVGMSGTIKTRTF
jgi:hypothetical protein